MRIKLGTKVTDSITGMTGIAIARTDWLYGCVRYGVQPEELKDGKPVEAQWFDEAQLREYKEPKKNKPTGGPARESGEMSRANPSR